MKKKLIEAIKAKFVGIDDNTATRLADRALRKGEPITTDDEVTAAVEAITLSDVLKSVSDFSADEATRKYEAKYGLENGTPKKAEKEKEEKPEEKPAAPKKDEKQDDPLAELKALFASSLKDLSGKIDSINSDIASIRTGKLTENRKAKLDQVIKGLRESQKKAYARTPLDKMTDDEFDSFLSEVSEEVNDIIAENKANGGVVSAPLGVRHHDNGGGESTKEATKEELDNLVSKFNL